MSEDYIVDVEHLTKRFNGKLAVNDVTLQIKKGEIFGFLGPNGSGKTTTIRMLCGLLTPDAGEGTCLGYDILTESSKIKRLVGYVPQYYSLYGDLTVKENLDFIARIYNMPDHAERVKRIMAELEMEEYANILSARLSGGWKQRLSLGAALIHDPQLLLLDEPTAGIDPKARRDFWNYISQLTTRGITSLVSTHYMDEAERCNRLSYIVYGELMAEGTIPEIVSKVGLTTYSASGKGLMQLSNSIREQKGVEQVVAWGNDLRVVGQNKEDIQKAVDHYPEYQWQPVSTSLEEVFVHLVNIRTAEKEQTP